MKALWISLFIFYASVGFALPASHIENLSEVQIRKSVSVLPNSLVKYGVSTIGDFNVAAYLKEIKEKVVYKVVDDTESVQGRRFLRYDVNSKTVSIPKLLNGDVDALELGFIMTHETLGALGYVDDNYQMSTSLFLLGSLLEKSEFVDPRDLEANPNFLAPFKVSLRKTNPVVTENFLARGGVTGAGGGGDPHSAFAKFLMVELYLGANNPYFVLHDIDGAAWIINHVGIESYKYIPGTNDIAPCPDHVTFQTFDKYYSSQLTDGMVKVYIPESCSKNLLQNGQLSDQYLQFASALSQKTRFILLTELNGKN
jgi:hypothetical protein